MLPTKETFREVDVARSCGREYKVLQIYPKKGTNIFPKRRLCEVESESGERVIIKAKYSGIVTQVLVKIDDKIEDGCDILELEACTHTALMGNICCDCGVLLDEKDIPKTEAVSMLHSVPDLKITRNEAQKLGKEDIKNLLKQRRLVLLVDLDQTLIHTTNDNIPANLKNVYHFQINYGGPWYHARLRPHTKIFLEKVSKYYELHISTFGVREYAHHIAHFLDPDRKLFGQRILSRNECLDLMSKKANLDSLFPCGDNLVCIIDDRTDVWNFSPNVVQVVPYHFFRHTGDINAPQGLQKNENDDREGIDFKDLKKGKIQTVGFPAVDTLGADEEDKKSYSSDSESDKDCKDVVPDTKLSKSANFSESISETSDKYSKSVVPATKSSMREKDLKEMVPETKVDCDVEQSKRKSDDSVVCLHKDVTGRKDEKISELSDNIYTKEQNKTHSIVKPDSKADSELSNDRVKDVKHVNTECDEPKPKSEEKSQQNTEMEMKDDVETEDSKKQKEQSNRKVGEVESSKQSSDKSTTQPKTSEDDVFDVVDNDDYLLYLEDVLKKIHKRFFKEYDKSQQQKSQEQSLPDLKTIVPTVRKEVLKGVSIVFSGVVPQQVKLQESKAYFIATSFGASVSERLTVKAKGDTESDDKKSFYTTHMVAANLHTEKVNAARKHKTIKIVTPNWLWKCAERWEHVEERLFPLSKETEKGIQRLPPHHCFTPEPSWLKYNSVTEHTEPGPSSRTRTPSGSLLEDVNPLMFFSPDEKNNMAEEVKKTLSDEDEDDDESDEDEEGDVSDGDTSTTNGGYDEEEDEEEGPLRKRSRGMVEKDDFGGRDEEEDMENEDELPSAIFRQGGGLPSDDSDDGESDDEGDLSQMGADLESLLG